MSVAQKTVLAQMENAVIPSNVPLYRRAWPLPAALLLLLLGLLFVLMRLGQNPPRWAYPLDDTYISMAMSRNLVDHGTWGINPDEFAPAASSPLWILLQAAAMKVLGAHLWIPFALVLACSVGLMLMVDSVGRREGWPDYFRFGVLTLLIIVTPLVPLTFLGMEHILHTLLTLWILDILWRLPEIGQPAPRRQVLCLLFAILLTTAIRFEGLFLALAVALVLIWQRRSFLAMGMVCVSFIPVGIHGIVSTAHGWGWFPSSVMLKGNMPVVGHPLATLRAILHSFVAQSEKIHIAYLFTAPLVVLALLPRRWLQRRVVLVLGVFVLVFLQHMCFAKTGWFFRYEAYLVAAQIFIIGLILGPTLPTHVSGFWLRLKHREALACLPLALVVMLPQIRHGFAALRETPLAMKNVRDQQCQMAAFIRRYYRGLSVAVNDIGAVSDLGQAHIIDLAGLANRTVFGAKRVGRFDTKVIKRVCDEEHVEIAMVYDGWFLGQAALPPDWRCVGSLKIDGNVICADETVSFYALHGDAAEKLVRNLRDFAAFMPSDVHVSAHSIADLTSH